MTSAAERREGKDEQGRPVLSVSRAQRVRLGAVLCVKFCKGRSWDWAGSCGLAQLGFLVLLEIVHVEVAVGFEPVLVGFDS